MSGPGTVMTVAPMRLASNAVLLPFVRSRSPSKSSTEATGLSTLPMAIGETCTPRILTPFASS